MKRPFLLLIIILQVFYAYSQHIEPKGLWVGSYQINNYETDGKMYSDTNEFLPSVLWFSENEIKIISFVPNYNECITILDTLIFKYRFNGKKILGNIKNDTVLTGEINNRIVQMKIGKGNSNVDMIFLKCNNKDIENKMDKKTIFDYLTNDKWKIKIDEDTIYEKFFPDNKFKLSTWDRNQRWDIFKILDCYFLVTNDCFNKPYISLIKSISLNEMNILVYRNKKIKRYTMIKAK